MTRLRAAGPADGEDDVARFAGVAREMHVPARRPHRRLVALEVEVEMGERVILDVARGVAQFLEFRQPVRRRLPPADEAALDVPERPLQLRVGERLPGVLLEVLRGGMDGHASGSVQPAASSKARTGVCHPGA